MKLCVGVREDSSFFNASISYAVVLMQHVGQVVHLLILYLKSLNRHFICAFSYLFSHASIVNVKGPSSFYISMMFS